MKKNARRIAIAAGVLFVIMFAWNAAGERLQGWDDVKSRLTVMRNGLLGQSVIYKMRVGRAEGDPQFESDKVLTLQSKTELFANTIDCDYVGFARYRIGNRVVMSGDDLKE